MLPWKIFDKVDVIWCILSVPKLVIINLKINIFLIINQQPKFCAIFFLQDQSRCALWHKNKYIHIFQGGSGGNSPRSQKECKKNGSFTFFIPGGKIYPVMMSIQIHARVVQNFFY